MCSSQNKTNKEVLIPASLKESLLTTGSYAILLIFLLLIFHF